MDLLEQSDAAATPVADAPAPPDVPPDAGADPTAADNPANAPGDDAALLGLPPGVSAPEGVHALVAPAVAAQQQIEWYHLDPNERYEELRLGTGPGVWRALAFGGLLSVLAIGLFYACMWFVEPSAALLNPFIDRTYSEARDDLAIHLGGLSPLPISGTTTQPTTAPAKRFDLADLRSAHRPSAGGDAMAGGTTWYRFDLPRDQVAAYRQHILDRWLDQLKHRVEDGGNDAAFQSTGAPTFWDTNEFDDGTRLRLLRANGDVAFQAAFNATRGRVYVRVNH
jgi:hypothetical protein